MSQNSVNITNGLTLADFTSEELIIPKLKARDMSGVIIELSSAFPKHDPAWDAQMLSKSAYEREQKMTTALQFLSAFPHVRSNDCPKLRFALGRSNEPFEWGRPGALKVQFVFLNAIPGSEAQGYLKLLSGMSQLGKKPTLLEQFKAAQTAKELMELLRQIPIRK